MKTGKKIIAVIVVGTMISGIFGACSKKVDESDATNLKGTNQKETNQKETTPEVVIPELESASELGALATKSYVYARLLTDEVMGKDIKNTNKTELSQKVGETLAAWKTVEKICSTFEQCTEQIKIPEEEAKASLTGADGLFDVIFPTTTVQAKEDEMTEWANKINQMYDGMTDKNLKSRDRFKQLAKQLGTDARGAIKQFQMANEILAKKYTNDGDFYRAWESAAMVTKTTCKVGLFVTGIIASGGTISTAGITLMGGETALGTAAIVGACITGGTDCIVDVSNTASNIFLGDEHVVTKAMQDIGEVTGKISTVFSIANIAEATAGEALSLFGENLVSWYQEGKVGGFQISNSLSSYLSNTNPIAEGSKFYIDISDKSEEEAIQSIAEAGGPTLSEEPNKSVTDWINSLGINSVDFNQMLEKIISELPETIEITEDDKLELEGEDPKEDGQEEESTKDETLGEESQKEDNSEEESQGEEAENPDDVNGQETGIYGTYSGTMKQNYVEFPEGGFLPEKTQSVTLVFEKVSENTLKISTSDRVLISLDYQKATNKWKGSVPVADGAAPNVFALSIDTSVVPYHAIMTVSVEGVEIYRWDLTK